MSGTTPSTRRPQLWRGFTLVELIVVILVLGVLAAIAVVAFNASTDRAHDVRAQADMKQLETATMAQATLQDVPLLGRQVFMDTLVEHFPRGLVAGTTAASGWGLLRVDDASPDVSTFAAGFDRGQGTVASDDPGNRAAVVLHSDSGRTIAMLMTWNHASGQAPGFCSGMVADGITPRMVLAGKAAAGQCLDDALQAPPAPTGLKVTVMFDATGAHVSWDAVVPVDVSKNGEWIDWATGQYTDPSGLPGDVYTVTPRPATGAVSSDGAPVTIGWNPADLPAGTDSVHIHHGTDPAGATPIADLTQPALGEGAWVDMTPTNGGTYVVVPVIAGVEQGAVGSVASAAPAPPTPSSDGGAGPVLTGDGTTFAISWNPVASTPRAPLTGYRLYRQPQGGITWDASSRIFTGPSALTSDTPDKAVALTWCYKASAYGPGGESSLSDAVCGALTAATSGATFTTSGTWTAPAGVTSIVVDAQGGGGLGASVVARMPVIPGAVYYVTVGYGGGHGGHGDTASGTNLDTLGVDGGGASDIRAGGNELSNRVVVAAGSGGSGGATSSFLKYRAAGGAGGAVGAAGANGTVGHTPYIYAGWGASGTAGGWASGASCGPSCINGSVGSLGAGGGAVDLTYQYFSGGGGGGGGYYGGGAGDGGQYRGAGGGGGSSYISPEVTLISSAAGSATSPATASVHIAY